MGYGTEWTMGVPGDIRLLWQGRLPRDRPAAYLKFVGQSDLEGLRGILHDPDIEPGYLLPVYEGGFPTSEDPEWEAWYRNQHEEFHRYIHKIVPAFLEEFTQASPEKLNAIDQAWGFPRAILDDIIDFARVAVSKELVGFAREVF